MEIDPRAGRLPGTSGETRPRIGHVRGYLLDLVCLPGHSRRATDQSKYREQWTRQHRYGVQFPERGWHDGRGTISERIDAGRRERRVLTRVSRAAWRLEQAERERTWALVSARAEGISIRTLATVAGLSPSRVHQRRPAIG